MFPQVITVWQRIDILSMKNQTYTQVEIVRGVNKEVAWIPSEFAQRGRVIKIKMGGSWSDGWLVYETYNTLPKDTVESMSSDHRKFLEVLDR